MADELSWKHAKAPLSWIGGTLLFLAHAALAAAAEYWITAASFMLMTLAIGYIGAKKVQDFRVRRQLQHHYQPD